MMCITRRWITKHKRGSYEQTHPNNRSSQNFKASMHNKRAYACSMHADIAAYTAT